MTLPLLLALLAQTAAPPATTTPPPRPGGGGTLDYDPRTEMIDFLGRRMLCARLPEEPDRTRGDRAESTRLACARLAEEERHWRRRFADSPAALATLDRDPERYEPLMLRSTFDGGPPTARARQVTQSGTDAEGRGGYRVSAALDGARALFTLAKDGQPPRRFVADLAALPELDLQTLRIDYEREGERGLLVLVRYGYRQGYCGDQDEDDRPDLRIWFSGNHLTAQREVNVNCAADYLDVPNGEPPR